MMEIRFSFVEGSVEFPSLKNLTIARLRFGGINVDLNDLSKNFFQSFLFDRKFI